MGSTMFNLDDELSSIADSREKIEKILAHAKSLSETDIPEALKLIQAGIALASKDSEFEPLDPQVAECFHVEGCIHLNQSDYRFALVSFSKAKEIYDVLDQPSAIAAELCFIGIAQGYLGLYPDALRNMYEALAAFEAMDDRKMIAKALCGIGYTYVLLNEYTKSIPLLSKSVAITREANEKKILAASLDGLALACLGNRELDNALSYSLESVSVCRQIGSPVREAENLLTLGEIHSATDNSKDSVECFRTSLEISRRYGFRLLESGALRGLGRALQKEGKLEEALTLLQEALAIDQSIGAKRKIYECFYDLSSVCKKAGEFERALKYYEQFHIAKEALVTEQAEFRMKSLETVYELKQATRDKEIFYLKNVALQSEIEERIKAQAVVEQLAITDPLTGLLNRRQLFYLADREVKQANRYSRPLSLVIFDIDHFKRVNDNYGHLTGDRVLSGISSYVQNSVRDCDVVGRLGGEEFAILLPETSEQSALIMFERIRRAIADLTFDTEKGAVSVTVSAGIAAVSVEDTRDDFEKILDRADRALYAAKAAGRNQTKLYSATTVR